MFARKGGTVPAAFFALALVLLGTGCGEKAEEPAPGEEQPAAPEEQPTAEKATITVGGKHFTEQDILGEIIAVTIETDTELNVNRQLSLGGTMICYNALRGGDLDVYAEYTGTGLVNILEREVISDPDKAYEAVKKAFKDKYDLIWLEPFGFNNTYTLTMRKAQAEELGIETISDLAEYVRQGGELQAGFDAEFLTRPDGYPGLCRLYDFEFPGKPQQMEIGLMYRAAADEMVDVIDAFATDGRIRAYDLQVLEDDKGFFPPYYAAPLVRGETLEDHPELREVLNELAEKIPDRTMQRLNYQVEEEGMKAREVARRFLQDQGLIPKSGAGAQ